jgi:hypothetical protein
MSSIYTTGLPYCTYLTTYFGNKLPIFYIGSSTIKKIKKGYHGSVSSKRYKSIWKKELKENPHLFKTKVISSHKNDKECRQKEKQLQIHLNVVNNPLYINMSLATPNGFFGMDTKGENNPFYNKSHTIEKKQYWSTIRKGIDTWNKNKTNVYSEKTLLKMSKPKSDKHKKALSKPKLNSENMGMYERTEDIRKSISNTLKSKAKIKCFHCDKFFDIGNYNRWHGDNCKIILTCHSQELLSNKR